MPSLERALGRLATLWPNRKFAATRHVAAATGLVAPQHAGALARANAAFVWTYYARFARLASARARRRLILDVRVDGGGHLATARAMRRGIILLSVHLGDFDAGGAWLAAHGVTPVVVAEPIAPAWRDWLFTKVRRLCGAIVRDPARSSLDLLARDLADRRAVLFMVDRRPPVQSRTVPSRILDLAAVASGAPAALAARTGAPLLPAAMWRETDGRMTAWFGEPITATSMAAAATAVSAVAERLGDLIRRHPAQWHVPADVSQLAWGGGVELGDARLRPDRGAERVVGDLAGMAHVAVRHDA
jgi:KDO2-lipid IV(A) lauroyltransferase